MRCDTPIFPPGPRSLRSSAEAASRGRPGVFAALLAGLLAAFPACARKEADPGSGGGADSLRDDPETRRMVQRLSALASDPNGFNPFALSREISMAEGALARAANDAERCTILVDLADMKNTSGDPRGALAALRSVQEKVRAGVVAPGPAGLERLRSLELTASLRIGELDNCLARKDKDCCVFPLRGGGLHTATSGFENAERLVLGELERNPGSLSHRWLLTVISMGLGKYPAGGDPRLVLGPELLASEQPFPAFADRAVELGVDVDDIAGGTVLDDFDNDGRIDLLLSSWGKTGQMRLFLQQRDGRFAEKTREAGLLGITGGLNLFQADYDNDGDLDVYVVRGAWLDESGRDPDSLLVNAGGGVFVDRTESAGLLSYEPALTALWTDADNDGWVDLYVGCESIAETRFPAKFYLNQRNGKFVECAAASGLAVDGLVRGLAAGDYDNDGWIDIYVSRLGQANLLLRNEGQPAAGSPGWKFSDATRTARVAEPLMSFPCWFWDYDNDGWLDIFVSGYTRDFSERTLDELVKDMLGRPCGVDKPRLYHNERNGAFADVTRDAHLDKVIYAMGANHGDLDNDGWLDFYAGTGDPNLTTLIPNRAFRNGEGRRFYDVTTNARLGHLQKGHAVAFGDVDDDGDQDVAINLGGAARGDNFRDAIFVNPGSDARWLSLSLSGTRTNRAAIGARIKVVVEQGGQPREIHRVVGSGGSFGASTLRAEIGLGRCDGVREIEIYWPGSRTVEKFAAPAVNTRYRCVEGKGALEKLSPLPRA